MSLSYHRHRAAVLLLVVGCAASAVATAQTPTIDTLALRAHTYFLSLDALEGRAAATRGEWLAARYIETQCLALGLAPVGDTYLQTVPLEAARVLAGTHLDVRTPIGSARFDYPDDVTPNVGMQGTLMGFSGHGVWVGDDSTITAGGLGRLDVHGAVAVMEGTASMRAFDTLSVRGALGVLHLLGSQEVYDLYRRSRGEERLYHRGAVTSSFLPRLPSILVGPRAAQTILAAGGRFAEAPRRPGPLGETIDVALDLERDSVASHNVACVLPGAAPAARDTAIALTAHLDHLGIGEPDSAGDSIYNGFSDNAAGVAMLLAIARSLEPAAVRPAHSVLLLFFGGEERGLLGSDYFVADPTWPLARIRAVVNLDAGAPAAPPVTWRLAGVDSSGLGALALEVAREHGWSAVTSPPKPNSDYYPFVRHGIPAVFIIPGPGPYQGLSDDSSNALRRRWDHYHQPSDEWHADFPFEGLARYAAFALAVVRAVDAAVGR